MATSEKKEINKNFNIKKDISVIMPVYNAGKYLAQCMDSVLAQTYKNFEVICVNDGSTDNSAEILENYQKKDNRIKIINQQNQGPGVARDKGVSEAQGKYIYFMDSDDMLHPELLEVAYDFATHFNTDLVSFGFEEVREKVPMTTIIDRTKIKYKQSNNPLFLGTTKEKYKINYGMGTKLYKKELLEGIKFLTHNKFEDFPHTFAVLSKKPKTIVLNQSLYFYRINKNSRSHTEGTVQQIKDYQEGLNYIYSIYSSPELEKELIILKRTFIPNILKHQLGRCRRADINVRPHMYFAFAEELQDLDKKGLISWHGHKLSRYWEYKRLIKEINIEKVLYNHREIYRPKKKDSPTTEIIQIENEIEHPDLWKKFEERYSRHITTFCLFNLIPILKIVKDHKQKQIFLFGFIPLFVLQTKN